MNNNDLIDRALVLEFLDEFCAGYPARLIEEVGGDTQEEFTASEIAEIVVANARALRDGISLFPAVEQQMSAVEYERLRDKFFAWCKKQHKCEWCDWKTECYPPWRDLSPEERVKFILKWAKEHPERSEE